MYFKDIHFGKNQYFQKKAYSIAQTMLFFSIFKMKLQYKDVTLLFFSNLRNFRQLYTILMRFFWNHTLVFLRRWYYSDEEMMLAVFFLCIL